MKRKRHPITLLEIMIVILLIGLIGGVVSYNLKGTLDRGKKFRSEEGISRLQNILNLEIAQGAVTVDQLTGADNLKAVRDCVENSGFIPKKDLDHFLKDGWNEPYLITKDPESAQEVKVSSPRLDQYNASKNS